MKETVLDVKGLKTYFYTDNGILPAVDGVDFKIAGGEILGVVGESGCGKSVTALSLMRLVPSPGKIIGGQVLFKGRDLVNLPEEEIRKIRGNDISMIFQEPMTSLNPVYTIGDQIAEVFITHRHMDRGEARKETVRTLSMVEMPLAEQRIHQYPHQLSGGMRQRVMIAMAFACSPRLLIADEPTTALDVTVQAQILELIKDLGNKLGTAIMFITHDLGVIAEVAHNVMVMYAGRVVEYADVRSIFKNPMHPYTKGLLNSIPRLDENRDRLETMGGGTPDACHKYPGCAFYPRCGDAREICIYNRPGLVEYRGHKVRCFKYTLQWDGGRK